MNEETYFAELLPSSYSDPPFQSRQPSRHNRDMLEQLSPYHLVAVDV